MSSAERTMIARLLLLAALLLAALLAPPRAAAQEPPPRGNTIASELVVESMRPAPGGTTTLAVHMRPKPGWHGYWLNPGDAGLPLTVDWTLPKGVSVGGLRFPTPGTLVVQGIMNHVYERDYAVVAELSVDRSVRPGTRLPVRAAARWLSCSDSLCVPEQAELSIDLVAGDGGIDAGRAARVDGWRAALPVALGSEARHQLRAGRLEIAIPFPADAELAAPHLFTEAQDLVAHGAAQRFRRSGDWLVASLEPVEGQAEPLVIDALLGLGGATPRGLSFRSVPGEVPAGGTGIGGGGAPVGTGAATLAGLFGAALLGGMLLNLMPCVFPILGLKALSLARAGTGRREARRDALAYLAGSLAACLALGALLLALRAGGAELGWAFQLQDPRIIFLLFLLLAAITANLAGLFELRVLAVGSGIGKSGGTAGSFSTGALAAFVATPCTGPFMAAALGAALLLPWQAGMLIFAGLGVGLALPFVAIAFIEPLRGALPRPGPWLGWFRRIMALPMFLTTVALGWLLWRQAGGQGLALALGAGALLLAALWLLGGRQAGQRVAFARSWPAAVAAALLLVVYVPTAPGSAAEGAADRLDAAPFSETRLAAATRAGKPAFAYFTADWCITCKANERLALDRPEVAQAFRRAGVEVLRGDFTRADPAIARFLAANGRSGVPLYILVDAQGQRTILPQLLTPSMLVDAARKAG